ncbi:MAG: DsrE family protein [Enterobacterales bacterium]|nr:DsrE family protein [Enterobacterales bacterium]
MKYKVLFDISKAADDKTKLNKNIESVARFINMHVLNGVKLENIEIAVVLHGKATRDGLNHKAYQKRYSNNNPTLDLIHQLRAKGVSFYQCGQSAYFQGGLRQ